MYEPGRRRPDYARHDQPNGGRTVAAKLIGAALIFAGAVLAPLSAEPRQPALSADDIIGRVNARPRGNASMSQLHMTLHTEHGQHNKEIISERARFATSYRTAYWITAPAHERGIGLLLSEDAQENGMWMYFPSTRQTVHVVSRGLPALASDFTCEDMLARMPASDYTFRILGYDQTNGIGTYRIEMKPASARLRSELGFANAIGWVRDDIWMIVRADYLDDNGTVFKTFSADDIRPVQGIWTAHTMAMDNSRARHRTEVEIVDIAYADHLDGGPLALSRFGNGFVAPVK